MQQVTRSTLNFFPFYEQLIKEHKKTTTLRLGDQRFLYPLQSVLNLTIGWDLKEAKKIERIKLTEVYCQKIQDLTTRDLEGESPDCLDPQSVKYCLGAIYRKNVSDNDIVTVIKWKYVN